MTVRFNLDFARSALYLTPTSTVSDSCVQRVSRRPFAFVIAVSDRELFNQVLLLHLRWSHRVINISPICALEEEMPVLAFRGAEVKSH